MKIEKKDELIYKIDGEEINYKSRNCIPYDIYNRVCNKLNNTTFPIEIIVEENYKTSDYKLFGIKIYEKKIIQGYIISIKLPNYFILGKFKDSFIKKDNIYFWKKDYIYYPYREVNYLNVYLTLLNLTNLEEKEIDNILYLTPYEY